MKGSAGVMALVLAEAVAGTAAVLWAGPLWQEVKRGFFKLTGIVVLVLAAAAWWSARVGQIPGNDAGAWSTRLAGGTAIACACWVVLLYLRREPAGRVAGFASAGIGVATLVAMAATARQSETIAFVQLVAGAFFLGANVVGLLLGHWYLTDRGLTRTPINRATTLLLLSVALEAVAVISGGFAPVGQTLEFNPLLTAGALAPWIALGMVVVTGTIAVMVRLTLKGDRSSAVQAATGFYYLAVITAFTAEVAVKVRFLPR